MKRQLMTIVLTLCAALALLSASALAADGESPEITRYTVLLLDCSDSMNGLDRKGEPMTKMKEAAAAFCEQMLKTEGTDYIAIVPFGTDVLPGTDFTDNLETLTEVISNLGLAGETNINDALIKADELLQKYTDIPANRKNILLLSDGLPTNTDAGSLDGNDGPYGSQDIEVVSYYKSANVCLATAKRLLHPYYSIYTIGFFHSEKGQRLTFGRQFLRDLSKQHYYEATEITQLSGVLDSVREDMCDASMEKDPEPSGGVDSSGPSNKPEENNPGRGVENTVPNKALENFIYISTDGNGEVIASARYAEQGDRITLSAHPADGYELDKITATNMRGREVALRNLDGGRYSLTMPDSRVTIEAQFVKTTVQTPDDEIFTGLGTPGISGIVLNPAPMPFTDVRASDWFCGNVEYMWKHYLMSGVSDTQFDPNAATSRAMIWTVLARMNNIRTDRNPGYIWYENGMLWAVSQGVTDGSNPLADITREQLATMLWRNAGSPGTSVDLSGFSDSGSVSEYALTAVRWAVANGILNGSNGRLDPQGAATRAQAAAMVARYGGLF